MSAAPRQLVVFGGQGSGKGTQAARLAEQLKLELIGAGDLLRQMAKEDTPSGRKIAPIIQAGQLVPDDMISGIVGRQLESIPPERGFVLEGYPRTVRQSELFKGILERLGRATTGATFVNLDVPREELKRRLLERQRHDDTEALIEERFRLYDKRTAPVLKAVEPWARVLHIDGNQPIEAVTQAVINQVSDAKAQA